MRKRRTPSISEEDIERVMEMVEPRGRGDLDRCREQVVAIIHDILKTQVHPPGKVRSQLEKTAAALKRAMTEIKKIPGGYQYAVCRESSLHEIDQVRRRSGELAARIKVTKSGGAQIDAAKMKEAAERAFDLLIERGSHVPTLYKDGPWISLTGILFKLATGKEGSGAARACGSYMRELERDGFSDRKKRRADRQQAKLSMKTAPSWLIERVRSDRKT